MTAQSKIAVVGAGLIGKRHIDAAVNAENGMLSAIVDPAPAGMEIANKLNVPAYQSIDALIAEHQPDGIILATPNQLHAEQAAQCIAAGIPTLIEKPIAQTLEQGIDIHRAADAARVPILVGHHRRHSAIMSKAREIIHSGVLGNVVAVTGSALFYKAENEGYFDGDQIWRCQPGGGPILINMIHEFDNLRQLCGEIDSIFAFTSNATRGFPVEDTASMTMRFASGALGTFLLSDTAASTHSWEHTAREDSRYDSAHSEDDHCYHIAGTFGSLSIPTMQLYQYHDAAGQSWHKPLARSTESLEVVDPIAQQMAHFIDVVQGNADPVVSSYDGVQNMRLINAVMESINTGLPVSIEV